MKLYMISIRPISSFCSPLQSDTLFGAFCWGYLNLYGKDSLHKLIQNYKAGNPEIIFSNAFPAGRLPLPVGMMDVTGEHQRSETKHERYQQYIKKKKTAHSETVSLYDFNRLINGDIAGLHSGKGEEEQRIEPDIQWRNMVSRDNDMVENIDGSSNLFEVEQFFSSSDFDVYIYSSLPKKILDDVLRHMFLLGIGAQRSVGKGAFEIVQGVKEFTEFQIPQNPNAFVALSNFVPKKDDPVEGGYKTFVKYPKVSYTDNENDSPFKKPIIFLHAGSVFRDKTIKKYYGSCIENIALKDGRISDEIIIGAYTIAVPCQLAHPSDN